MNKYRPGLSEKILVVINSVIDRLVWQNIA